MTTFAPPHVCCVCDLPFDPEDEIHTHHDIGCDGDSWCRCDSDCHAWHCDCGRSPEAEA